MHLKEFRLHRLLKVNKAARKLFPTGMLPAYTYGLEVTGVGLQQVREVRNVAAKLDGCPNMSRDVWGALRPERDPLVALVSPPIMRYSEEVWRMCAPGQSNGRLVGASVLRQALENAEKARHKKQPLTGPVAQMLDQLHWAGWKMVNLFTLQDREGFHRHLGTTPTASLLRQFRKDVLKKVEERAEARMQEARVLAGEESKEWEAPWWDIMRKYQRSKEAALNKHLTLRAHGGHLLTAEQSQQWGYETDGNCQACPGCKDTGWHRITSCKKGRALRTIGKEQGKQRDVRSWQQWQLDLTCSQGLRRFLAPNRPTEALPDIGEVVRAFIGDKEVEPDTFRFLATEAVGADGTATNVRWGPLARAAWAAVQLSNGVLRWIGGTVGRKQGQNAVTAEHEAATTAVEKGARHSLVVDCAAVQVIADQPDAYRCKHSRVHAGYWKRVATAQRRQEPSNEMPWIKTRAHVEVPANPTTTEDHHIVLNDHADRCCKRANTWHQLSEDRETQWKQQAGRALGFMRDAGELLARYPRPRDEDISYVRQKKGRKLSMRVRYVHDWHWTAQGSWRCRLCMRIKWSRDAAAD